MDRLIWDDDVNPLLERTRFLGSKIRKRGSNDFFFLTLLNEFFLNWAIFLCEGRGRYPLFYANLSYLLAFFFVCR